MCRPSLLLYQLSPAAALSQTATKGRGGAREAEQGPASMSLFIAPPSSPGSPGCLLVLLSVFCLPQACLAEDKFSSAFHFHCRVRALPPFWTKLTADPWLEALALGAGSWGWLLGGSVSVRSRLPCSCPAKVSSQILRPSEILRS